MSRGNTVNGVSVTALAKMTGRALACFLVFDVIGVVLTLIVEAVAALDIVWEGSALLGYVTWFVVGVFCAAFIYPGGSEDKPDSAEGRRRGLQVVVVTAVVAVVLGMLSSFVWSASDGREAVAPDHRGVTITYLVTVVLAVAGARFVLFRETVQTGSRSRTVVSPPDEERLEPVVLRSSIVVPPPEPDRDDPDGFKPAGFWMTLGFLIGVPVLLFLDVSFFVLGPFDYFDVWTDPLLTASLVGGVAWGFAAARWQPPRNGLLAMHAPLLIGTIFYIFGLLIGGLLVAFGVPGHVADIVTYVAFGMGFLLGCGAVAGWFFELFERAPADPAVRP